MPLLTNTNVPLRAALPSVRGDASRDEPAPGARAIKLIGEFVVTMAAFLLVIAAIAAVKIAVWLPSFNF